ncbi:MAG: hypothetical protein JNJ58_01355 [Chitinophagaceae bacterium]|nr:hypothetical protein [Chitinophagaceae bacterium]
MIYNIDTREQFDIFIPQKELFDDSMSDILASQVEKARENGRSLILQFEFVKTMNPEIVANIVEMHETMYQDNLSFVICCLSPELKIIFHQNEFADQLNICPTLIEAIDIVSMEGLERELLGGE